MPAPDVLDGAPPTMQPTMAPRGVTVGRPAQPRAVPGRPAGAGVATGAGAMICVGGSVAVSGVLAHAPVFTAEALRYAVACLILLVLARLTGRRPSMPHGMEWLWLAGVAATGLVLFNVALVAGSRHAEPAVLGVAVACVPALLAVIGPLAEGSRPYAAGVAAALVVTCGAALVQGVGRTDGLGVAWAAVVFGCEAAFTLLAIPVLSRHGPWGVSVHTTWIAALMFAVIGLACEGPGAAARLGTEDWLAVGYLAVAVTAAAFVMWYSSVGRLGASRAGLLTGVAPIAAVAVGVLLGGPPPRPLVWAGIAVVAVGLALGLRGPTQARGSLRPSPPLRPSARPSPPLCLSATYVPPVVERASSPNNVVDRAYAVILGNPNCPDPPRRPDPPRKWDPCCTGEQSELRGDHGAHRNPSRSRSSSHAAHQATWNHVFRRIMHFQHSAQIWRDFPALVPGVLYAEGITGYAPGTTGDAPAGPAADRFAAIARSRLAAVAAESELPEIQAWRRAFAQMGLKPTQYRCASESLLRRFRKEGSLPRLHPLVDLCNAVSLAFATPVAVLDVAQITSPLEVRYATGDEQYLTFAGDVEHPAPGEVIFADGAGQAHARRWTNRQSGRSAVRDSTACALIVAEALHDSAPADIARLIAALATEIQAAWSVTPQAAVLTASSPRFATGPDTPAPAPQLTGARRPTRRSGR